MQSPAQAYRTVATQTASPRELEADLLLKAAARLQTIKDNWERDASKLSEAFAVIENISINVIVMTVRITVSIIKFYSTSIDSIILTRRPIFKEIVIENLIVIS